VFSSYFSIFEPTKLRNFLEILHMDTLILALGALFVVLALVQGWFWGIIFNPKLFYKECSLTAPLASWPKVTVLLCAHNEAQHLPQVLPHFLSQDYPDYEVLVVDDASSDTTPQILEACAAQNPRLRWHRLSAKQGLGKRPALRQGLSLAQGQVILLSDADCYPASPQWIEQMIRAKGEKHLVLGFSPYTSVAGVLNRCVQVETLFTAIQYYSAAAWGHPYMGVGRNLLYDKSLIAGLNWQAQPQGLASGDDDLAVNALAKADNTALAWAASTKVWTSPPTTWKAWYRQKTRHLSTAIHYQKYQQVLLMSLAFSHTGLYFSALILLFLWPCTVFYVLPVLGLRQVLLAWVWGQWTRLLDQQKLKPFFWFFDFFIPFYHCIFAPTIFFKRRTQQWK
jgi:glycosyltransferase involved in cell wall biosynthesis